MLIRAAIVEDSVQDQRLITQLLEEWAGQSSHQLEVTTYEDSDKLLGSIDEAYGVFDVYLLDIEMRTPQEGLSLAQMIRSTDKELPIIFISNRRELALESYDVHALYFIAKPIDETRFFAAMNRLASILSKRSTDHFAYSTGRISKSMPLHEVVCISTYASDGHYLIINGDPQSRFEMKLEVVANQYPEDLIRCHKSHIVNISHVRQLTATTVILSNESELPVGRIYLNSIRTHFAAYHRTKRGRQH